MIGFQNVVNCVLKTPSYRMLGFGQLGCSGFVVVNKDGRFVDTKTKAYLDYGDQAFSHVEALLFTLIEDYEDSSGSIGSLRQSSELPVSTTIESSVPHLETIGIDSMDQEHRDCSDAMNQVMNDPSKENLKNLHNVVKSHFDHEEKLMNDFFDHSNDSNALSTIRIHANDHSRILDLIESEIHKNTNEQNSSSTSCGSCCEMKAEVDISFLRRLATSFEVHVKNFDGLYKGVIPSHAH